jgi:hypothetical protein
MHIPWRHVWILTQAVLRATDPWECSSVLCMLMYIHACQKWLDKLLQGHCKGIARTLQGRKALGTKMFWPKNCECWPVGMWLAGKCICLYVTCWQMHTKSRGYAHAWGMRFRYMRFRYMRFRYMRFRYTRFRYMRFRYMRFRNMMTPCKWGHKIQCICESVHIIENFASILVIVFVARMLSVVPCRKPKNFMQLRRIKVKNNFEQNSNLKRVQAVNFYADTCKNQCIRPTQAILCYMIELMIYAWHFLHSYSRVLRLTVHDQPQVSRITTRGWSVDYNMV